MLATVELKKWNDATVLQIPSDFLTRLDLKPDTPMSLQVQGDSLVLRPQRCRRIGIAEGKFVVPDDFDLWDKEIEGMFGGML